MCTSSGRCGWTKLMQSWSFALMVIGMTVHRCLGEDSEWLGHGEKGVT